MPRACQNAFDFLKDKHSRTERLTRKQFRDIIMNDECRIKIAKSLPYYTDPNEQRTYYLLYIRNEEDTCTCDDNHKCLCKLDLTSCNDELGRRKGLCELLDTYCTKIYNRFPAGVFYTVMIRFRELMPYLDNTDNVTYKSFEEIETYYKYIIYTDKRKKDIQLFIQTSDVFYDMFNSFQRTFEEKTYAALKRRFQDIIK